MADAKDADLQKLIQLSRKSDVNFGLCLGKVPESTVLEIHRKRPPELLGRIAKKAGETAKVAFGTLRTQGKVMNLTCDGNVPSGLSRRMRLYLSSIDLKMKVVILDPSGAVLDSEDADEPEDTDDAPAGSDKATFWKDVEQALGAKIAARRAYGDEIGEKVGVAWDNAAKAAQAGDKKTVLTILGKIKPHLTVPEDAAAAQTGVDPRLEMIDEVSQTVKADLRLVQDAPKQSLAEIVDQLKASQTAKAAGNLDAALAALNACTDKIAQLRGSAAAAAAKAAVPDGLVKKHAGAIELVASKWTAERMGAIDGLQTLIAQLKSEGDPELASIAKTVQTLCGDIPQRLDGALSALEAAWSQQDAKAIEAGKAAVMEELYVGVTYLKNNQNHLALCEDNPFDIDIAIVAPIAGALKSIRSVVTAL